MRRSYKGAGNPNYRNGNTIEKVERICFFCKEIFLAKKGLSPSKGQAKFCSRRCVAKYTARYIQGKPGYRMMQGYKYLLLPDHPGANSDGYYAEHRLAVEQSLGRLLTKQEVVHHKNRLRNDNRIENLELLASNRAHRKEHHQDLLTVMGKYWTPEKRKEQADRVRLFRKTKFWTSRKKAEVLI